MDALLNVDETINYFDEYIKISFLDSDEKDINKLKVDIIKYKEKCNEVYELSEEDNKNINKYQCEINNIKDSENFDPIKLKVCNHLEEIIELYEISKKKNFDEFKRLTEKKIEKEKAIEDTKHLQMANILRFIKDLNKIKFNYNIKLNKSFNCYYYCMDKEHQFIMGLLQYIFKNRKDILEFNDYLSTLTDRENGEVINRDFKGMRINHIYCEFIKIYQRLDFGDKLTFLYYLTKYLNNVYATNIHTKIVEFMSENMIYSENQS